MWREAKLLLVVPFRRADIESAFTEEMPANLLCGQPRIQEVSPSPVHDCRMCELELKRPLRYGVPNSGERQ